MSQSLMSIQKGAISGETPKQPPKKLLYILGGVVAVGVVVGVIIAVIRKQKQQIPHDNKGGKEGNNNADGNTSCTTDADCTAYSNPTTGARGICNQQTKKCVSYIFH